MDIKKIKLMGTYYIKDNNKLSIDNNLFFDLSKISFISDEIISDNPIENNQREISFYFTFIIDGILFEVRDNQVLICHSYKELDLPKHYPNINVFKLRRDLIKILFP